MSDTQPSRRWSMRRALRAGWRPALVVGALVVATLAAGMSVAPALASPAEYEETQSAESERDFVAPASGSVDAVPAMAARDLGPHGPDAAALPAPVLDVPENPPERA
ncbi:MAG: hypothetical protein R2745_00735 [Vicinamibacterales bacterium]